jgi:cobalt-zinc-cadmium efflux system protein
MTHDHHHHDHADPHGHAHHHHHHAMPQDHGKAFALAVGLNVVFVGVEGVFGVLSHSTALLADAGHNLSDVLGLLLAWGAMALSRRPPSARFTYGLRSTSIFAALTNAFLLLLACGAIAWEAIARLQSPAPVGSTTVMVVAGVGIVINGLSAWLFARGSQGDLNIRGAYLHMLADAAVSLGVVLAGFLIGQTGWQRVDPLVSLFIVLVIVWGTWGLLRESLALALHAVPQQVDVQAVRAYLLTLPGVSDVHDMHVWGLSTTETALTAHVVMPDGHPGDVFLDAVVTTLRSDHGIAHCALQVEIGSTHHECDLMHSRLTAT